MAIRLDLVRHGAAVATSPLGDAGRELSADGAAQVRMLAAGLARDGWRPGVVFTSPLTRARQTTSLLLQPLGGLALVHTIRELMPEQTPAALFAMLEAQREEETHVLAVGHQPLLGSVLATLTGESPAVATGSFHAIELPDGFRRGTGRILERR